MYYFKGKKECDFIVKEKNKVTLAVQVSWTLNENNREREIQGLLEALEYCRISMGMILTNDGEERITKEDKTIRVMPVWKWLLEQGESSRRTK